MTADRKCIWDGCGATATCWYGSPYCVAHDVSRTRALAMSHDELCELIALQGALLNKLITILRPFDANMDELWKLMQEEYAAISARLGLSHVSSSTRVKS